MLLQRRVVFHPEIVDLCSLVSVQKLAKRLRDRLPKLDALVCNAGISGVTGVRWGELFKQMAIHYPNATTWPTSKINAVGWVTKPQIRALADGRKVDQPEVGEVFCANFFGHYMLGHYLAPLLARHSVEEQTRGRIVWVSSLDAYEHALDLKDIQGISAPQAYESSKRLTDVMGITSLHPANARLVDQYLGYQKDTEKTTKPRIYVAHPGIISTPIVPVEFFLLAWFKTFGLMIARWFGSIWHPTFPYKGAVSMVWLVLANQVTLDSMEAREGIGKWGSATNRWGEERVERTEVDEWGWGGKLVKDSKKRKGRSPYAKEFSEEDKQAFEKTGQTCWAELERLRLEWESRLNDTGVGIQMD
jgi:3-keto steroid reductase